MMKALFTILILGFGFSLFAQQERQAVRKGNDFYEQKKYTEAEVAYRKGLEGKNELYEGKFNLSNSLIKQKKYDEAIEQLQILAQTTDDKSALARIYHNLGNAMLESQQLEKSIDAYKQALRNNSADNETRYNLAYAQSLLKQQQEQEKQNQDKQDENKEDQEKKDQEQNKDEQQNQDQQNQDQEQKDQEQKEQDQQQNKEQNKQQDQQQEQNGQMSKQAAEQILNALQQDEKQVQEKVQLQKAQKAKTKRVEKDW